MSKKLDGVKVQTPYFTANWVYLFEPRKNKLQPDKKPQYSITMLFQKGQDLSVLKNAALAAIEEAWPDKTKRPKELKLPFKDQGTVLRTRDDGTEFLPEGYTPGAIYLEAKTINQPGIVGPDRVAILDSSEIYSGCICRALVVFKAYDFLKKRGVTCYLQHVQKVKDGKRLGGSNVRAEDVFSAIEDFGETESAEVESMLS